MNYAAHTQRLQAWIADQKDAIDAVLIVSDVNRQYFSGFTGSFGYLVITKDKAWLLTDFRYVSQAAAQAPHYEQIKLDQFSPAKSLTMLCDRIGAEVIAFEGNRMTYDLYHQLVRGFGRANMINRGQVIDGMRSIKSAEEIALMEKAQAITDATFTHILDFIRPGVTEKEIALELEFHMRRLGASGNSFDPIVAAGPRGALPHAEPSDHKIEAGELLTMDFGCIYESYCSDMTRTVAIGEPDAEMRKIYDLVLATQKECIDAVRPGVIGKDIHQIAVNRFERNGLGEYFGHGLGHSLGMEIHEEPRFSRADHNVMQPGMIITVEPGLYLPGKGGVRIEDMILITEDGHRDLTASPKELLIL